MMASCTITGRIEWVDEPGDGSICLCCGDAAWLSCTRLYLAIDGRPASATEFVLCQSCKDEVNSSE